MLAVAERIFEIAPWEFMSDLELLGLRDDTSGKLHAGSILGTLGTMFAVMLYRNDAGLRSIHDLVSSRVVPESDDSLEGLDYLKIEWCHKGELQKHDRATLAAAGFKPKGKGAVWPRFETCTPGWYPWGMTNDEAQVMTGLLRKVHRFVALREVAGILHQEPLEELLPILPAGDAPLRPEEIEWLPFVPPPAPIQSPAVLSGGEQERLAKFPIRKDVIAEVITPLVPEMSFLDEKAKRPCLARFMFTVDVSSQLILGAHLGHGAAPIGEVVSKGLVSALTSAKARPERINVKDPRLIEVMGPACEAIGVPLHLTELQVAPSAWTEFLQYTSRRAPR
jgi:hypothetical protein